MSDISMICVEGFNELKERFKKEPNKIKKITEAFETWRERGTKESLNHYIAIVTSYINEEDIVDLESILESKPGLKEIGEQTSNRLKLRREIAKINRYMARRTSIASSLLSPEVIEAFSRNDLTDEMKESMSSYLTISSQIKITNEMAIAKFHALNHMAASIKYNEDLYKNILPFLTDIKNVQVDMSKVEMTMSNGHKIVFNPSAICSSSFDQFCVDEELRMSILLPFIKKREQATGFLNKSDGLHDQMKIFSAMNFNYKEAGKTVLPIHDVKGPLQEGMNHFCFKTPLGFFSNWIRIKKLQVCPVSSDLIDNMFTDSPGNEILIKEWFDKCTSHDGEKIFDAFEKLGFSGNPFPTVVGREVCFPDLTFIYGTVFFLPACRMLTGFTLNKTDFTLVTMLVDCIAAATSFSSCDDYKEFLLSSWAIKYNMCLPSYDYPAVWTADVGQYETHNNIRDLAYFRGIQGMDSLKADDVDLSVFFDQRLTILPYFCMAFREKNRSIDLQNVTYTPCCAVASGSFGFFVTKFNDVISQEYGKQSRNVDKPYSLLDQRPAFNLPFILMKQYKYSEVMKEKRIEELLNLIGECRIFDQSLSEPCYPVCNLFSELFTYGKITKDRIKELLFDERFNCIRDDLDELEDVYCNRDVLKTIAEYPFIASRNDSLMYSQIEEMDFVRYTNSRKKPTYLAVIGCFNTEVKFMSYFCDPRDQVNESFSVAEGRSHYLPSIEREEDIKEDFKGKFEKVFSMFRDSDGDSDSECNENSEDDEEEEEEEEEQE